uniref:Cilia- and flagella-associated protein 43 n=1 Tax=Culicoides sonorensis TaxID=179676 RepID=A0A336L9U7_CULSO
MKKINKPQSKVKQLLPEPSWVKFVNLSVINFVGENVIAFGADQHILLLNYESKEESIYVANNEENGDGVACLAGHSIFPLFAFAEAKLSPRIFVISYPEFAKISILKNDETPYKAICFSETEHLIALKDSPTYMIQVWYWRSHEMLVEKKTYQRNTVQVIGISPVFHSDQELYGVKFMTKEIHLLKIQGNKITIFKSFKVNVDIKEMIVTGDKYHTISYGMDGKLNIFKAIITDESPLTINLHSRLFKGVKEGHVDKFGQFAITLGHSGVMICTKLNQNTVDTGFEDQVLKVNRKWRREHSKDTTEGFILTEEFEDKRWLDIQKMKFLEKEEELHRIERTNILNEFSSLKAKLKELIDNNERMPVAERIDLDVFNIANEWTKILAEAAADERMREEKRMEDFIEAQTKVNETIVQKCWDSMEIKGCQIRGIFTKVCVDNYPLAIIASDKLLSISMSYENPEIYSQNDLILPEKYISISPVFHSDQELYGVKFMTKEIHLLKIQGNNITIFKSFKVNVDIKEMIVTGDKYHTISYGMDGKLNIFKAIITDESPLTINLHSRFFKGVKQGHVDKFGQFAITLGHSGVMICTKLNQNTVDTGFEDQVLKVNREWRREHSKDTTEGFILTEEFEDKRWLDIQKMKFLEKEEELHRIERTNILNEFSSLKAKLKELIDNNERMPVAERIDLDVFNIANEWTKILAEAAADERMREEKRMKDFIEAQTKVNETIVQKCWDSMEIKGCQIRGIFTKVCVDNYPLAIVSDAKQNLKFRNALLWRKLEVMASCKDEFLPWIPIPANQLETLLSHDPDLVTDYEKSCPETILSLTGTRSFNFIERMQLRYQQMNIVALAQIYSSQIFGNNDILRLREYFNKLFQDLHLTKEDEMDAVSVTNRRLRHIQKELKQLAELKNEEIKDDEAIDDPIFFPAEQPETIVKVEDNEVGVLPYISPSKQKMLDALAVEKERLRQELMADDFRDRALVAMMDGVLEHKWEDEIKKPVWKPSCMLEKDPRDYDEMDLEAVKDYHKRVKHNLVERDQYREMLIEERSRLKILLKDRITNFNYKVAKLQLLKLQIDACINAEELRLLKTLDFSYQRIVFDRQEFSIRQEIETIRKQLTYLGDTFTEIQEKITEFKSNYETLNFKDKQMDKQFKANFAEVAPLAVVDPAYKIFRRRPKYQIRAWATVPILLDLAKRIVTKKTFEQGALLLPIECVDYMNLLDQMDTFTGATGIDANVWQILCRMRRAKIESEFKLKAYGLQLAEADTTANAFSREMHHKRNYLSSLENKLENLLEAKQKEAMNRQVQLVMKRGQIEVDLSGKINDFKNCVLIHKKDIYDINEVIQKAGHKKLKAMMNAAIFRRKIITKEWEHRVLRLTVRDMKDFVQVIDKCKITKEVQMWLKRKERGWTQDLGEEAVEADIKNTIAAQEKLLNEVINNVKEIQHKINAKRRENKKLDQRIQEVNLEITETGMKRNIEFVEVEHKTSVERMEFMVERSRLIRKIQEQHSYILELNTLAELQKLKTYPTLTTASNLARNRLGH